jgi:hypothetical protein
MNQCAFSSKAASKLRITKILPAYQNLLILNSLTYFSGKIHAPKNNFLAVHEILMGITEHWSHEAEAMSAKKQKDLMENS